MFRTVAVLVALACAGALRAHPEIEDALARLNTRIAAAPDNADLYVQRGELYARHEEWVMAEANYLRAAELSPAHPRLDLDRGEMELATRRPAEALAHLDAALVRDPRSADALVLRGRAHAALHARDRALADFDAALSLISAPTPELFLERAALLPPVDALRSLDEAIGRIGPAIALQLRALSLEESLGRIDEAAARLDRIAGSSERREAWLKRRGDLLARAGRPREARAAYVAALAAIATLPDWLRQSPETASLAAELARITSSRS